MTQRPSCGLESFHENGFAFCGSLLTCNEAAVVLQQVENEFGRTSTGVQPTSDEQFCRLDEIHGNDRFKAHLFLSGISWIVHHPSMVAIVRRVLKTDAIALWSSDLNIKKPCSNQYFSQHQDATYTGLNPADHCVTVWVALSDPVGTQEGCLTFLKGSHLIGQLPHVEESATGDSGTAEKISGENMLSRGQREVYEARDTDEWVAIPLRAGEATIHHFHTIHESGYNHHPTQPRVGLALRYIAFDVQQTEPVRESVTWIDYNYKADNHDQKQRLLSLRFDLEPKLPDHPTDVDVQIGRHAHAEAMRRESANYFNDSAKVKAYDGEAIDENG
jgi:non-haem Fe2+, alpha-ketoglutarate-dependent halogenase